MNDIVLITSVIDTGKYHWSYSRIRSVYTPQERFEQSLKTIESVRTYLPNSKIFFIECSDISQVFIETLESKVEYFLNLNKDEIVREACLETDKKGWGEAEQTRVGLEFLLSNNIEFSRLFKLSARYYLTDIFKENNFPIDTYVFRKGVITGEGNYAISTVLFSVPYCYLQHFYKNVKVATEYYPKNDAKSYEEIVPPLCSPYIELEQLGVSGGVAVDRKNIYHG